MTRARIAPPIELHGLTLEHHSGLRLRLRWEVARCLAEAMHQVISGGGQCATCGWVVSRTGRAFELDGRRFDFGVTLMTRSQLVALGTALAKTQRMVPVLGEGGVKPATFAPCYVACYPVLAEKARELGYALAIHGSVSRDFDLVAIPWRDGAVSALELVAALAEIFALGDRWPTSIPSLPEKKPHGRVAYLLDTGFGSQIDLSIMPTETKP